MITFERMYQYSVTIFGIGWLGKALALSLIKDEVTVHGTVTSQQKVDKLYDFGIKATAYKLGDELIPKELCESDYYVITIPPRGELYIENLKRIAEHLPPLSKAIYISSTSVYPDSNSVIKEGDEINRVSPHSGISLLEAENALKEAQSNLTVLRMAGLFGPGRPPGRFLAGRSELKGASNPVNLVHLEDCIGVIKRVIEKECWSEVFNVCAEEHHNRKAFYTIASRKIGLPEPTFNNAEAPFKIVDNKKSKELLGYSYLHPDPLKAL